MVRDGYDRFSWRALFLDAGYEVGALRGIFLKVLSTAQMMDPAERQDISRLLEVLCRLGEDLQDHAWYLLLVARSPAAG